jgi:hypothetical protein
LTVAIGLLALSAILGTFALGALTKQLTKKKTKPTINGLDVRLPAMAQMLTFALGIISVAAEIVGFPLKWGGVVGAVLLAFLAWQGVQLWRDAKEKKAAKAVPDDPTAAI